MKKSLVRYILVTPIEYTKEAYTRNVAKYVYTVQGLVFTADDNSK